MALLGWTPVRHSQQLKAKELLLEQFAVGQRVTNLGNQNRAHNTLKA